MRHLFSTSSDMARSTRRSDTFNDAFDGLFADAYSAALDVLGDEEEAEDIAVEATARTYARWARLESRSWRRDWVVLTALGLALDVVERSGSGAAPADDDGSDDSDSDFDSEPPTDQAEGQILAIAGLPRREREVIAMRDLAGFSIEQCSEVLRASERTVAGLEGRGRTRLQESVDDSPDDEGADEGDPGGG